MSLPPKEVMSVNEESTSCYCLLEAQKCHVLLEHPGRYALVGEPLNQEAGKRLRLAVFGSPDASNSLGFTLRVYCVDDTPHAFQVRGKREMMKIRNIPGHYMNVGVSYINNFINKPQLVLAYSHTYICHLITHLILSVEHH